MIALGDQFGRWTVIGDATRSRMQCRCVCGVTRLVARWDVVNGRSRSCGCAPSVTEIAALSKQWPDEYRAWRAMQTRCWNPRAISWKNYGGRGVGICDRWREFANFIADMGPKPSRGHSLDRKDTSGNYEPDNCRWATRTEQNNNMRRNVLLTLNGRTQNMTAWSRELGLHPTTISRRRKAGLPDHLVLHVGVVAKADKLESMVRSLGRRAERGLD